MHSSDKKSILAMSIAIVALGLSAYSVFGIPGVSTASVTNGGDFEQKVYDTIDKYVADQRAKATAPTAPEPVDVDLTDDDPSKGDEDAPVVIVEFSDYECPFCGKFFSETLPKIQENYIDTGKVKYVFRDFPLSFHPNARPAANAAECVHAQSSDETYFTYHDILFQNQHSLGQDKLIEYAGQLSGIDVEKFTDCLEDNEYDSEISADMDEGQKYGVKGTPGFFINGRPLSGAQPYANFERIIEEELAK